MLRRGFLLGALAAWPAWAHTPYGQWTVYRKKHLLIGCHREAPDGYAAAKAVVADLAEHLPEARARVARAPHAGRLARLFATDQLDVAVLSPASARAMRDGQGAFVPYGPVSLAALTVVAAGWICAAHARLPARHAWLIAEALAESSIAQPGRAEQPLEWHPGAEAFLSGDPVPAD
ncbi:MAG: hypothetical protein AAF713_21160 [Pseudomonadota bacterium]